MSEINDLKSLKEPKQEIFEKSFAIDKERDSAEMQEVKKQIDRYQQVKGTVMEAAVLRRVIKACDNYTRWKFSLFKFGNASTRLQEVKRVRAQAVQRKNELMSQPLSREERQNRRKEQLRMMREDEKFYAPEIKAYNNAYMKSHPQEAQARTADIRNKMALLKKTYPNMTNEQAVTVALETIRRKISINDMTTEWVDDYVMETFKDHAVNGRDLVMARKEKAKRLKEKEDREEKKRREKEDTPQKRAAREAMLKEKENLLKEHNAVSRFFLRSFGGSYMEMKAWESLLLKREFQTGADASEAEGGQSLRDEDYETRFI